VAPAGVPAGTAREARWLLDRCSLHGTFMRSAIYLPDGGPLARHIEPLVPGRVLLGGMLLIVATIG